MGKRFIQFYDNHGLELLGTSHDARWIFDNRMSNNTALSMANAHVLQESIRYQEAEKLKAEGITNSTINNVIAPRRLWAKICQFTDNGYIRDLTEPRLLDNLLYV